jgi:transcriptional regulator GlxA family with amidase domain
MPHVTIIGFDSFTDIDLFMAWDLFSRVSAPAWRVEIAAPTKTITSITGITIAAHAPLESARRADAVYVASGDGTRRLADAPEWQSMVFDESRQLLAAVDSGALLLATLGHLRGRRATTYPDAELHARLAALGVELVNEALVVEGNVATAAQCLAGVQLVEWVVSRLVDERTALAATSSAMPLGVKRAR